MSDSHHHRRQPSRKLTSAVLPVLAQGGKGSLAYELAVSLGRPVECTVVDTHAVQFSVFRSKEFLHRCGIARRAADGSQPSADAPPGPGLAGVEAVDEAVVGAWRARRQEAGSLVDWLDASIAADDRRASQLDDVRAVEAQIPLYQLRTLFDDKFLAEGSATAALFGECGLVLGLHPDQATEPIVDACLAAGKAFAVVPCCVFPEENPHRRVRRRKPPKGLPATAAAAARGSDALAKAVAGGGGEMALGAKREGAVGKGAEAGAGAGAGAGAAPGDTQEEEGWDWVAVRSIEQFVEYLVAKDPTRVRTAQLTSVPGRNTIVYYCPDECAMREESGGRKRAAGEQ